MIDDQRIQEIIAETLLLEPNAITDTLAYQAVPEWDSTGHMVLVAAIEDAFEITIDAEDIERMNTVARIKSIVRKYSSHSKDYNDVCV